MKKSKMQKVQMEEAMDYLMESKSKKILMEMKDAKNIIVTKIRIHGKNISIKHLDVKEPKISVEKKLMQN